MVSVPSFPGRAWEQKEGGGDRGGVAEEFFEGAGGEDVAAFGARAGAEIDEVVGAAHHGFVVFDDEERVAAFLQGAEGGEQAFGIARVEAEGRFVEDEANAAQPAAELRGETGALEFAAG